MRSITFFATALLAANVGYAETHSHTVSEKSRVEEGVDVLGVGVRRGEDSIANRVLLVVVAVHIEELAADRRNVVVQRTRLVAGCEAAVHEGFVRDRIV